MIENEIKNFAQQSIIPTDESDLHDKWCSVEDWNVESVDLVLDYRCLWLQRQKLVKYQTPNIEKTSIRITCESFSSTLIIF